MVLQLDARFASCSRCFLASTSWRNWMSLRVACPAFCWSAKVWCAHEGGWGWGEGGVRVLG